MKIVLRFLTTDSWGRPVFEGSDEYFYGSTDILTDNPKDLTIENICYFGNSFDCEPMGDPIKSSDYIFHHNLEKI